MRNSFVAPFRFSRFLALCLCAVFALSLLLGAAYVFAERRHHCEGERCAICAAVRQTVLYLAEQSAAVMQPRHAPVSVRPSAERQLLVQAAVVYDHNRSLVSLCVKLSS